MAKTLYLSKSYQSRYDCKEGFTKFRKYLEDNDLLHIEYHGDKMKGVVQYKHKRVFLWQVGNECEEVLRNNLVRQLSLELNNKF